MRESYLEALSAPHRSLAAADPGLDGALAAALETARKAWPQVSVAPQVFAAFLGERAEGHGVGALQSADAYLACGCAAQDPAALTAFDEVYLGRLAQALARTGTRAETVAEVIQRLRVQLLVRGEREPDIVTYQARSDLHAWLRVVATREAARVDKVGAREVLVADDAILTQLASSDPELSYLKEVYRREVVVALGAALRALPDRERRLLRHNLADGLSIDELGVLYQVHRATAARWLEKARELLGELVRTELETRLHISAPELDGIFQLVRSRLDVSVRQLFHASVPA